MPKVLLLHNNKMRLKELHHSFVQSGFDVLIAKNAAFGQELFHEEKPDCVVADVLLSGKSVGELAQAIKNSPAGPYTPFLLTSPQFRQMQLEETAKIKWKVDRFFSEPYAAGEIVDEAMRLLERYAEKKETALAQAASAPPEPVAAADDLIGDVDDLFADVGEAVAEMARETASSVDILELTGKPAAQPSTPPDSGEPTVLPASRPAPPIIVGRSPAGATTVPSVPEEGDLKELSVAQLFASLHVHNSSGTLEVRNEAGATKIVYIRNGIPVYVESDAREETLGQVLVKHGIINQDTAYLSLQNMSGMGKKQGGALLDMGAVTPMQLYQGLKLQIREKLVSLFAWSKGNFYYDAGPIDTANLTVFEINPVSVMLEGLKDNLRASIIREVLDQAEKSRIRLLWSDEQAARFGLPESCVTVLSLIDDKRTVARIIDDSGLEEIEGGVAIYVLKLLGAFEKVDPQEYALDELLSDELDGLAPSDYEPPPSDLNIPIDEEQAAAPLLGEPEPAAPVMLGESEPAVPTPEAQARQEKNSLDKAFDKLDEQMTERRQGKDGQLGDLYAVRAAKATGDTTRERMSPDQIKLRDQILTDYLTLEGANFYEVMHLERECPDAEIKDRFREIAKSLHADVLRDQFGEEIVEKANAIMARVNEAYQTIGDIKRRREYNRRLSPEGQETRERHISTILVAEREFSTGLASMNRSEWKAAQEHFEKAVEGFPEESAYHAHLGWSIYHTAEGSKMDRAMRSTQLLEKAIKINPKADKPYYFLGVVLRDNGYPDKASKMFAQAYRHNRKNVLAMNEMRKLRQEKADQHQRALQRRRKAEGKSDDDSRLRDLLAKDFSIKSLFRKKSDK